MLAPLPFVLTLLVCAFGVSMRQTEKRAEADALAALQARVSASAQAEIVRVSLGKVAEGAFPAAETANAQAADENAERLNAYAALKAENEEFVGWITIADTQIDYPVMQSVSRPRYYYRRDFSGEASDAGLPFLDEASTLGGKNLLVYGHNMKNGSMFGELKRYLDADFLQAHLDFRFDTFYETRVYRVVSVILTSVGKRDSFRFYDYAHPQSDEAFAEYSACVTQRRLDSTETMEGIEACDSLLTLVTCSKHETDGRLIVVAKRVS